MLGLEKSMMECLEKQKEVESLFLAIPSEEQRYEKIIQLGRSAAPLEEKYKSRENIVPGCQSVMHMHAWMEEGRIFFAAESEALISSGLAQLLIMVYSGVKPEVVLKCPPDYLERLNISASLSPNRANGLYSIHLKMKQQALKLLIQK